MSAPETVGYECAYRLLGKVTLTPTLHNVAQDTKRETPDYLRCTAVPVPPYNCRVSPTSLNTAVKQQMG